MAYGTFLGDNRTLAMFLGPPPWDQSFKPLRHNHVWEAAAGAIPAIGPWIDPDESVPITDVGRWPAIRTCCDPPSSMASRSRSVCWRSVTLSARPTRANGWGASLALTHAFAAVDAVNTGGESDEVALSYHDAVGEETEAYFRASAAQDRIRTYRWRGEEIPEQDREEAERQDLIANGLNPAMRRDMHVLRAMMRRNTLVDRPDDIWSDEQALEIARETAAWRKANPSASPLGPPREELLAVMAAAEA